MSSPIEKTDTDEQVTETNKNNGDPISVSQSNVDLEDESISKDVEKPCPKNAGSVSEELDTETKSSVSQLSETVDPPQPIFEVIFRDESVSQKYEQEVRDFLQNLISMKQKQRSTCNLSNLTLKIWDNGEIIEEEKSKSAHTDASNDMLFTIDTKPKLKDDLDIPTYGKKYNVAFENFNKSAEPETKKDCAPKLTCFNCMGNHNLRDCPNPRNQTNINKNRKDYMFKGGSNKNLRYHLDDDQRFGHFIPGQLSKNLRKALGLKDGELPKHIYRMRMLGYPPGWLEEARLQHSGLSLINSEGIAEGDPNDEPGEIINDGDRDQFDIKKICDFPGFNIPPPPGTRDEYGHQWAQVQMIHSKETMLGLLRGKKAEQGYKRKKLKLTNANATYSNAETTPKEMEVEEVEDNVVESLPVNGFFLPPLPKESPAKPPEPPEVEDADNQSQEPPSPDSNNESIGPSSRTNSPSLSDLESIKKQLLVELEDSSSHSNPETPVTSTKEKSNMPPPSSTEVLTTPQSTRAQNAQNTPTTNFGSVKSVDLGTPILQTLSPYSKLPSSEKFSKNICDVINFENLPDATGKYEQMSGLIQKVRDTLAKIQQE